MYAAILMPDIAEMNLDSGILFNKIKASAAYCLCRESGGSEAFVWTCGGFRGLCEIKADVLRSQTTEEPARTLRGEVVFLLLLDCSKLQMYVSLKPNRRYFTDDALL